MVDTSLQYLKDKYSGSGTVDGVHINNLIKQIELNRERNNIYDVINGELDYQNSLTKNEDRPDMIEDFHLGDALSAMQYNLDKAREAWYSHSKPHVGAMGYIRKIVALGVRMGLLNGIPPRLTNEKIYTNILSGDVKDVFYLMNIPWVVHINFLDEESYNQAVNNGFNKKLWETNNAPNMVLINKKVISK